MVNESDDAIFAFSALAFTVLGLLLMKTLLLGPSFEFRRMTLPSVLLTAYLIIMPLPSILWFLDSSHPIRYTNLVAVDVVPLPYILGVWLANRLGRIPPHTVKRFLDSELCRSREDGVFGRFQAVILVASAAVVGTYLLLAEDVALVASIQEYGAIGGDRLRHSIYELPDALIFAYAVVVRLCLPFCVLYSFLMAKVYRRAWRVRFGMVLTLSLVGASLSLERSPTLGILLMLLLAYPLSSRKRHGLLYAALVLAALFLGGLIHQAQYQLDIERRDIVDYMSNLLLNRIWLDPSYMTAVAFREFNSSTTFLRGQSIRLLSLFGIPYQSFSSVGFVGDLWVNFGWPGVVLGSTLLGFTLQMIQGKCFQKKTVSTLVVYVLFLANALWLLYGSILSTMVVTVFAAGLLLLRSLPRPAPVRGALEIHVERTGQNLGHVLQTGWNSKHRGVY